MLCSSLSRAEDPSPERSLDGFLPSARSALLGHKAAAQSLLVLGPGDLDANVASMLRNDGWRLHRADGVEDARALCQRHDVLVGLLMLPRQLCDKAVQSLRETVVALQDLEWLAVLAHEHLTRLDVRRLVLGRFRGYQLFPVDPLRLSCALEQAWSLAALAGSHRREQESAALGKFGLVGTSPPMRQLYGKIERVAAADLPVLILGETGTGKELVARALHGESGRAAQPFLALNCAAIPASLVQSELFGVTKGAYTGASSSNIGLIESAAGGTLLLDEIGEMPLESQATLLRFLEDKRVTRVGGRQSAEIDVTVIASTNRDLHKEAREGRFRRDLLYRLEVLSIKTPPLRERTADIPLLAEHLLQSSAASLPRGLYGFTDDALDWLQAQPWHGNVRELRSYVIQAALHCGGAEITAQDLEAVRPQAAAPTRQLQSIEGRSLNAVLDDTEKATLEKLLIRNRGNVTRTARALKVSRMTLYRLMAKHDIDRSAS